MNNVLPDFDALLALHRHDPGALENFRRHLLREAVDQAPLEHRATLEQLIARMEAAREAASDPMEAALSAFRMMQESAQRLHGEWQQAVDAVAGLQAMMLIEQARTGAAKSGLARVSTAATEVDDWDGRHTPNPRRHFL